MSVSAWCWGLALALLCASVAVPAKAQDQNSLTRSTSNSTLDGDQIVVVCTRCFPSIVGQMPEVNELAALECDLDGNCREAPVDLMQAENLVETWVFVHGNQIPAATAIRRGTTVYRRLRPLTSVTGPIRFVIWSWPSERTTNRIADARIKSRRTDVESFLLGSFLAATAEHTPINIVAYSFGARVASGAMHLFEGGSLCGRRLPDLSEPVAPFRVAFLAAAVEHDGILRNGRYERALRNTEHLLLQNNSRDQALRFFWILNRCKPTALGHFGLSCAPRHCRVRQYDWAQAIGKDHSLWQYVNRPAILQRIAETFDREK